MTAQQLGPDSAEQTLGAVNFQRWQVGEWQREWGLVGSRDWRMRNPLKREIPGCEVDAGTMDEARAICGYSPASQWTHARLLSSLSSIPAAVTYVFNARPSDYQYDYDEPSDVDKTRHHLSTNNNIWMLA